MNTDMISYDENGAFNNGLYHRALMVARELHRVGRWDGQTHITIVNPENLCREMQLFDRQAQTFVLDVDYRLQ